MIRATEDFVEVVSRDGSRGLLVTCEGGVFSVQVALETAVAVGDWTDPTVLSPATMEAFVSWITAKLASSTSRRPL